MKTVTPSATSSRTYRYIALGRLGCTKSASDPILHADPQSKPLGGLGAWAQALSYLDFSMGKAIDAIVLYREGIPVRITAPERFSVHKLIVASARSGTYRSKSEKDLTQVEWLITTLAESRPFELAEALEDASDRGRKWRQAIDAALNSRPALRELIEGL